MTYNDIIKLDSLEERQSALIDYYINEVKVLEWIYDEKNHQHLVFNNREEFKYNNKYHKLDGPAIIMKNGTEMYYIDGELMEKDKWKPIAKGLLREKKLDRILD